MLRFLLSVISVILICLTSCVSSKKVVYFNDLQTPVDSSFTNAKTQFEEFIQKNDQLSIVVGGSNAADLIPLNAGSGASVGGVNVGASGTSFGYLVEADGSIQLPYLGKLKVEGMTRVQLQDTLAVLFKDYTKNPIVNVRFLNYAFSVLGEVVRSGRYPLSTERMTILEALSLAGDLTTFGKANNITVIREEDGKRTYAKVNLLSKDIFKSPYFYIRARDIIYVEPVPAKYVSRTGLPQYFGFIAGGISLIISIITFSRR